MGTLSEKDQRTLRLAVIGVAIYLVLFFGLRGWKSLEARKKGYELEVAGASRIKEELLPYENRMLLLEKLKETMRIDPTKLSKATLVAEASAAIQKASREGGVQLGPLREAPARSSSKELTSIQLEGSGPVAAVLGLLQKLDGLGFPLAVDSVQLGVDASKPGMLKMSLTIVIFNFDQFKSGGLPNA